MRRLARSARNSPKASKRTAFTAATATRMPRSKSPISSSLKKSSAKPQAEPKRRGRRIAPAAFFVSEFVGHAHQRSEEHTSELQSLMRISYAVFCLKKKTNKKTQEKTIEKVIHHHT